MITFDYITGRRQGKLLTDEDTLAMIRNHFSVKNDAKAFAKGMQKRFIKDRKYAVTPTGLFDFGLHKEIRNFLISQQITEITYSKNFTDRYNCGIKDYEYWAELKFDPRYYQEDAIKKCLKVGNGTIEMGTGAGKSLAQALLIENFMRNTDHENFKCLIIVPGLSLVTQLQNDFNDYGVTFSYSGWTGKDDLQDTQVVICNSENLTAKFFDHPWLLGVNLLITDEAHRINSDANISKLVSKIKTNNKFGFTGTLSDKLMDRWKTIGVFGPVIYKKTSKELRDEDYLSDVEITVLQLNHGKVRKMKYQEELTYLYNHERRNDIIKKLCSNISNNSLVLVNHLDHCDNIESVLRSSDNKKVFVVKGETPVDERVRIIQQMETDDDITTVAMSSIFSTGINVKNIHNIFLIALGKSFIRIIQSIGRGLRLHKNKNKLRIFDVCDIMDYGRDKICASERHSLERQRIYDMEQIKWRIKTIDV